jgi:hypothetical protein
MRAFTAVMLAFVTEHSPHLWPGHHSLVGGELMVQGEVLQSQRAMAAEKDGEEPKQIVVFSLRWNQLT